MKLADTVRGLTYAALSVFTLVCAFVALSLVVNNAETIPAIRVIAYAFAGAFNILLAFVLAFGARLYLTKG
jgi:uncharacterized protein YebE (UPF0316 family)